MKNIKAKDWGYLVLFITIVLGLGFLVASATTTQIQGWYSTINHPHFLLQTIYLHQFGLFYIL